MRKLVLVIALLIAPRAFAQCAGITFCQLAAADSTTVQNALNSITLDNTVVSLPSASVTWGVAVTWNRAFSITVQGQSTVSNAGTQTPTTVDSTVITLADNFFPITTTAGKALRITGITWKLSGTAFNGPLQIHGPSTQLRIDHNHFLNMQAVGIIDGPLGVVDHNFFDFSTTQSEDNGFRVGNGAWNGKQFGDGSWADTSQFGSSKFLFFEDNTAYHGFINDCNDGGRFVMRHNYFHDATMQGHEMESRMQGCRAWEVYANTFFAESGEQSGPDTSPSMLFRTGTGLIWGNTTNYLKGLVNFNNDRSDTEHGFTAANSSCITGGGSFNCWGYACNSQGTLVVNNPNYIFCQPGGSSSVPFSPSGFDGNTDGFGYPACQQIGRGKESVLFPQFDFNTSNFWAAPPFPCNNAQEPAYLWLNTLSNGGPYVGVPIGGGVINQDRDWFTDNAGSLGVRTGTSTPATCSTFQAFWNTNTNTLSQCTATNTWTSFYGPYPYPHPLTQNLGWVYIQDGVITSCNAGSTSCTFQNNNVVPTTAGTVWVIRLHSGGAAASAITSVSGGGATCHLCPSGSCHLTNVASNDNQDLAYCFGGAAGTTNITVNISPAAAQFWGGNFMELLPPVGSTPLFDTAKTNTSSSCTTCTAPNLTLSGIDAVAAFLSGNGAAAWNSFSSPYVTDIASDGIGLNITDGTGPSVQVTGSGGDFTSIAFTSSFGSFNPPPATETLVHYTTSQTNCNPTCSITVPATAAGNLLYLEAADLNSSFISSTTVPTGGGSWFVPSGSNSCRILLSGGFQLSCAYVLAATANATTIHVTMSGSGATQLGVFEVATTGIPFTLDQMASKLNGNNIDPPGVSFCASGCDAPALTGPDVVFGAIFAPGGPSGVTFDPQPLGGANWFFNEAAIALRTNVQSTEKPVWAFGSATANTTTTGMAFSSAPATNTAPLVSFSASSVNFGNLPVGIAATPMCVTVTNIGTNTVSISSMSVGAPFTFSTSPATNCGGTLAPATMCTITFNYTPVAPVTSTVNFTMVSNSLTSPDLVSLTGIGTTTPAPAVPVMLSAIFQ